MAKGKYEKWLEPDGLLLVESWARSGLTDEQIAHNMDVAYSTLRAWRDKYSALSAALKRNKEIVDVEVENALLKRALGYSYTETTSEREFDPGTGQYQMVVTKTVTKHVVPDTTAQIFWLKNRRPDLWRDKQNLELSGNVKTQNPFAALTTEQLMKLAGDIDDPK